MNHFSNGFTNLVNSLRKKHRNIRDCTRKVLVHRDVMSLRITCYCKGIDFNMDTRDMWEYCGSTVGVLCAFRGEGVGADLVPTQVESKPKPLSCCLLVCQVNRELKQTISSLACPFSSRATSEAISSEQEDGDKKTSGSFRAFPFWLGEDVDINEGGNTSNIPSLPRCQKITPDLNLGDLYLPDWFFGDPLDFMERYALDRLFGINLTCSGIAFVICWLAGKTHYFTNALFQGPISS